MKEGTVRELIAWRRAKPRWTGSYDYFAPRGMYAGKLTSRMLVAPLGLPHVITAREAVKAVFRSPLLLERLCAADWLNPGDKVEIGPIFRVQAIYQALARLGAGQKPPRLPKEKPARAGEPEIGPALKQWRYVKTAHGKVAQPPIPLGSLFLQTAPTPINARLDCPPLVVKDVTKGISGIKASGTRF
ncbi:MAG: hypothetical protein ACKOD5_03830 [Chthoniobacterales bacterium]